MRQPLSAEPSGRLHGWAGVLLVIVVITSGATYAYCAMFSHFEGYDDEGKVMCMVQYMLDGHPVYDVVHSPYGPAYFGLRWLIHRVFAVAVANDTMRLSTLVIWMSTAGMLACAVYRMCRGLGWALGAACLCFTATLFHLQRLTYEPGHAQDMIVALIALAVMAATFNYTSRRRGILFFLGAAAAALVLTKANVGIFFLASLTLALLIDTPVARSWSLLRGIALLLALSIPAIIFRARLHASWAVVYGSAVTLGLGLCWMAGRAAADHPRTRLGDLLWTALGTALAAVVLLAFAVGQGNSLRGIVNSLWTMPLHSYSTGLYEFPMPVGRLTPLWLIAGAAAALLYIYARGRLKTVLDSIGIPALKLVLGAAMLIPQWAHLIRFGWLWGDGQTFLWLTLVAPAQRAPGTGERLSRRLLCFVACLQGLQMYPIAGTQMWVGTILFVAIGALWVSDGLQAASVRPRAAGLSRAPLAWLVTAGPAILLITFYATQARRAYQKQEPVSLPGCTLTRMTEPQAASYRCLADTVRASCDTFVCYTGFQSLYFWSGTQPVGYVIVGNSWDVFSAADRAAIVTAYRDRTQMLWVDHPGLFGPPKTDVPFIDMVHQDFRPAVRIDHFSLWVSRQRHGGLRLRSCAWPVALQATDDRDTARLAVSLPQGTSLARITRVMAIDLDSRRTRGDGTSPRQYSRADFVSVPDPTHSWELILPRPKIPWAQFSSPALRFYADSQRVLTVPIAVDLPAGP